MNGVNVDLAMDSWLILLELIIINRIPMSSSAFVYTNFT